VGEREDVATVVWERWAFVAYADDRRGSFVGTVYAEPTLTSRKPPPPTTTIVGPPDRLTLGTSGPAFT